MARPGITVEVQNQGKFREVAERFDLKRHPRFTTEVLRSLGLEAVAWAKVNRFIAGGRFKAFGRGGQLGDAPAVPGILTSRTGRFRDGISVGRSTPTETSYGPNVRYAPTHELGLRGYPKRPVIAPTQEWIAGEADRIFTESWRRYVGRTL